MKSSRPQEPSNKYAQYQVVMIMLILCLMPKQAMIRLTEEPGLMDITSYNCCRRIYSGLMVRRSMVHVHLHSTVV